MVTEELVRKLTKEGVLITPELMEEIKSGRYQEKKQSGHDASTKNIKLSVRIKKPEPMETLSPKQFMEYYNNRFSNLRDILVKKSPSISINKTTSGQDTSLTGMVRERSTQGFVLEDVTGEISVVSGEAVKDDDVISVRGTVAENKLIAREIIWPDVPLTNQPKTIPNLNIMFATDFDGLLREISSEFDLVFTRSNGPNEPRIFTNIPSPANIAINKEGNEFSVLVYEPTETLNPKDAIGLLRRRHLMPQKKEITSTTDHFFINTIPNLFWVISNQRHVEHYKGVTLVLSKKHDSFRFDCESGSVYFSKEN